MANYDHDLTFGAMSATQRPHAQLSDDFTHDIIVLGAGSSGCVVAGRLAAAGASVALIEAGPDPSQLVDFPGSLRDCYTPDLSGAFDWNLQCDTPSGPKSIPRGRVVGGSSAINSCVALRPESDDFEAWGAAVGTTWTWPHVLPHFRSIETDVDFPDRPEHGSAGPIPVVRWKDHELEPASRAFMHAALGRGHQHVDDLNAPNSTGIGPVPMNREGRRRVSAADAYLSPANASRIRLLPNTTALRVVTTHDRVIGVEVTDGRQRYTVRSNRVVISAGAYGTPVLLMRSGLGPSATLRQHGIPVVASMAGVGTGLMDHSQVFIPAFSKSHSSDSPCLQTLLRFTSEGSTARNDLQLCVLNRVDAGAYAPGHRFDAAPTMACVLLQYSQSEGTVGLTAGSDMPVPHVMMDYTSASQDRDRYRSGLRELAAITRRREFESALDISWDTSLLADDAELDRMIGERAQTAHHPIRTARMGNASDELSVVDENMRFLGIEGLFIADASVIPVPIRSNINLTCLVLGHRAAEVLLDEFG